MLKLAVLFGLLAITLAEKVSIAEQFQDFVVKETKNEDPRLENAYLDVPEIIRKYGYPAESHYVPTSDGYILQLQRIPHGLGQTYSQNRVPVFVMHGMMGSAADWVIAGPEKAFAYALADAGYDVWLGNARGTYYSRNHATKDPDSDITYWQFTWDEIGNFDLASSVDFVLSTTGHSKLHYVGHSQGCTTFLVLTSLRPEYNEKIISFQAMAPAAYNSNSNRPALEAVAPYLSIVEGLLADRGIAEIFPRMDFIRDLAMQYCKDGEPTQVLCSIAFFAFGGFGEDNHDASLIPVILGHTPAGASFRQIAHFSQVIATGEFKRYDYGFLTNLAVYGSLSAPAYDLTKVTTPTYIWYGPSDKAVVREDLERLDEELPNSVGLIEVLHPEFNHIDFLYSKLARELIYDRIISTIVRIDNSK